MKRFGGHSMSGPLQRVLVCPPAAAGWKDPERAALWQELGYQHATDFLAAHKEHEALLKGLAVSGAEIDFLPETAALGLDAVYVHDASFMTEQGVICLCMGKPQRRAEAAAHRKWYESQGIPVLGEIKPPGTVEAGDIVWLDPGTLLVGRGYRTNACGVEQLRSILSGQNVTVMAAPLPHGSGPGICLHLMSLLSILDEQTVLTDLSFLAVETVELLRDRAYRVVEIDCAERATLACNVLALGNGGLLALEANHCTNRRLGQAGFHVVTFPGSEICTNGGGGPTCLTRPILRKDLRPS